MRFNGLALLASAMLLGACGGGGDNANNTAGASAAGATTVAQTAPTGATTAAAPAAGAAAAAPATGTTHTVQMVMEGTSYKFVPADISVKAGDAIKWVMVSGAPHNVAFLNVPADAKSQLDANMPEKVSELAGKMLMNPNEEYTVSFANVKPGKYEYVCQPHAAMGMKGTVTVQ
ncbi:MAG TPA: plastocyanin/azurin family copper-binding protein [Gemmatimonadaceae bacterium]|nr:plastocyanin/azurin family copper-binding protein [Gemmatimonadaceae bacterium]